MLRARSGWLIGLAMGLAASVSGPSLAATGAPEIPAVDITSFSGAYLAARVAEVDNDLDAAIAYYKRALAFDPENQQLRQSLLLALLSQGRFDESLPYADKLKEVADVERFSRLALAIDSFRKKDYPQATFFLKLALASDLDSLISRIMTAWSTVGDGRPADALAQMEKLEGPDWYSLFVTYHRALIADAGGNAAKADEAYRKAVDDLAAGSAAPETWLRAAEAYAGFLARQGKKADALAVLTKADGFAAGRLPIAALRAQIEAGTPVAPLVAAPAAGASEVLLNLGTALNRGGGEAFVRLYLQLALALAPDSDAVLVELADVAEQQERSNEAIDLYRRVPATSPLKRLSELQMGLNLADLDRHDEAIKHLSALIEQQPDDLRAYLALGGVYASEEKYRAAADIYDRAVKNLETERSAPLLADAPPPPAAWNIYYQRGIAYERLKEWPKAEPNFRRALEIYPDQPQVLNYLGYSWVDMNMNLDEGLGMIQRAVDLRPSDGYIVDSLGWAYYRLGRYEDAVRELERAVSLRPDDPVLNDHLGDALWRVGRRLEATFQWSHARDMKPDAPVLAEIQKKLASGLAPVEPKAAEIPAVTPAPVAPVAPAPAPEKRSDLAPDLSGQPVPAAYKVLPGQSLWSIAADRLGAGNRYREIIDLNPGLKANPARLMPGQELTLPAGQ